MIKIRTYRNFTLTYRLEPDGNGFAISITKDSSEGCEDSTYKVSGDERELKALVCRMWSCSVTPMSLRYILQDEGYLPQAIAENLVLNKVPRRFYGKTMLETTDKKLVSVVDKD